MSDDVFSQDDFAGAEIHQPLGPAYFAARRAAENIMAGSNSEPMKKAADQASEAIREALYDYFEASFLGDVECNIQGHIYRMVDATVNALLQGHTWAIERYALAQYRDGEEVRAAVCKHGGEPLLMARIADLERELVRVREQLRYAYGR